MSVPSEASTPRAWAFHSSLDLRTLFSWCSAENAVDRLLVVARMDQLGQRRAVEPEIDTRISSLFEGNILTAVLAGTWPGTRLFGHRARVTVVRFDAVIAQRMIGVGPLLWDWTHESPCGLPEDLCLFRLGAELPTFFSVTHEGLSWVVSRTVPPFGEPRPVELIREKLFIPRSELFCDERILKS